MIHPSTIPPPSTQPNLLDQIRPTIPTMHYSRRTEEAYVQWIKMKTLSLRTATDEVEIRKRVKTAGGKWDSKRKAWQFPDEKVKALLDYRIGLLTMGLFEMGLNIETREWSIPFFHVSIFRHIKVAIYRNFLIGLLAG